MLGCQHHFTQAHRLDWYAIKILRRPLDILQRFDLAGVGSGFGLSLVFWDWADFD